MRRIPLWTTALVGFLVVSLGFIGLASEGLNPPTVEGHWIRPSTVFPAQPIWGHADGLQVGLWPLPGPRGLLRIYAPYLGHAKGRMINYIAIEPVLVGDSWRSFSELEESTLDGVQGLRFWSADSPQVTSPRDVREPSYGAVSVDGGIETLTVFIFVEPYRHGARVVLRLRFRSDRPYEVGIAAFTQPGSEPLSACVITATMGNFARLRTLHLSSGVRSSLEMWPSFPGGGFTHHICFPLSELILTPSGDALFVATPDEEHPEAAAYEVGTFVGWRYYGQAATQYWRREEPPLGLRGCVNARATYWASEARIPGGISFENFELIEPFQEGSEVWFGVQPGMYEAPSTMADPVDDGEPPQSRCASCP